MCGYAPAVKMAVFEAVITPAYCLPSLLVIDVDLQAEGFVYFNREEHNLFSKLFTLSAL